MPTCTYLGIDATNWIHQLWHARGGRGVVNAAVDRAVAVITALEPSAVVFAFDRRSFRHDRHAGYKASRPDKSEALAKDLVDAEKALAELGTIAAEDGAEADDCLATLAAYGRRAGVQTVIASPDKDLRQCLGRGVLILRAFATEGGRPTKADWYTDRRLFDEYGFDPCQWTDYQALCGDRGDGVDGCPGWGDVTAKKALGKCKTLEAMFANPFSVPCTNEQRYKLLRWQPASALAKELVTLRTDVSTVWDALR